MTPLEAAEQALAQANNFESTLSDDDALDDYRRRFVEEEPELMIKVVGTNTTE